MKDNHSYFYSELEDQIIVNSILEDFKSRQQERKPFELNWELNMNFYLGNQNTYISSTGEISNIEKNFYWENADVYNHIAPVIESRLAKLNKIKPSIDVKPQSSSDKDIYSAKLTKSILNKTFSSNHLEELVSTATHWSEITGTSFYKVTWENELGDIIGEKDGHELKNGDVKISVCSPFEIYPDSNSALEIDDCNSIIEARAVDADYINMRWNKKIEGEDLDVYNLDNSTFHSNIFGKSNCSKITRTKTQNQVLLIERYEKPNKNNPNGKLTIICKDTLLYDGELPYQAGFNDGRYYPFIKQVSIKQLACFWGMSVIERCIPIQKAYNAIKNKKHEYISRLASGVLTVEDGSVDIENLESEGLAPGKILVYRNGSTPPQFMSPGKIPEELEKEEEKLLAELNNMCCISDLTTSSNVPSNVNSGSALTLLIEQDESRLSLVAEHVRTSFKEIAKKCIKLYKQYATSVRLGKFVTNDGILEMFYWTHNDLTTDEIYLKSNNELEESKDSQKNNLLSLFEKGILFDNEGTISNANRMKILELFGFKNWEFNEDIDDIHKEKAKNENLKLIKLCDPMEIDNHKIHVNEHVKFIISDFNESLDETFKSQILEHINKHKKYLI